VTPHGDGEMTQVITLTGVDLTNGGTTINDLITSNTIIVDI